MTYSLAFNTSFIYSMHFGLSFDIVAYKDYKEVFVHHFGAVFKQHFVLHVAKNTDIEQ